MTIGNTMFRVILIVVLMGTIIALGAFAFRSGMNYGLAQSVDGSAVQEGTIVHPMAGYYPFHFMGFGLLHILGGLFFFFIVMGLLRMILFPFRGFAHTGFRSHHWKPGIDRCWDGNTVPPMVEEWHRRMHEEPSNAKPDQEEENA